MKTPRTVYVVIVEDSPFYEGFPTMKQAKIVAKSVTNFDRRTVQIVKYTRSK